MIMIMEVKEMSKSTCVAGNKIVACMIGWILLNMEIVQTL
jgi:hypothetical protein